MPGLSDSLIYILWFWGISNEVRAAYNWKGHSTWADHDQNGGTGSDSTS